MKITFALLFSLLTVGLAAQKTQIGNAKIQRANAIVWFGVDFTHAYLVGREGFTNPDEIVRVYWNSWNDLILNESEKYDIAGALMKGKSEYDLTKVRERNATISADGLVKDKPHEISESDVAAVVSDYTSGDYSDGVGLVFVVENFNKLKQEATVWVAFFDISTHELIQTKRFSAGPRGFGFRNYWAGAIYSVIEQIREDYKAWAKKAK
jgi:hypothetical protein